MDPFLARTMMESLSKGIDPLTGRVLPDDDICAKEEVQEALLEVLEHCSIESTEQYLLRLKEEKKAQRKERRARNAQRFFRGSEAWSEEEEAALLQMHRNGCKMDQIANYLKRPPNVVGSRLQQLKRRSAGRAEAMLLHPVAGDTLPAAEKNRTGSAPNRGNPWTKAEDDQLRAEYLEGTSMRSMARKHGRTQGAIESRLKRLALK